MSVVNCDSTVGGGAFPTAKIASTALRIDGRRATEAEERLRAARVPVIGRVIEDAFCLDLRSVPELHDDLLAATLTETLAT